MQPFDLIRKNLKLYNPDCKGVCMGVSIEGKAKFRDDIEQICLSFGLDKRVSLEIARRSLNKISELKYDLNVVVDYAESLYEIAYFVIFDPTSKSYLGSCIERHKSVCDGE